MFQQVTITTKQDQDEIVNIALRLNKDNKLEEEIKKYIVENFPIVEPHSISTSPPPSEDANNTPSVPNDINQTKKVDSQFKEIFSKIFPFVDCAVNLFKEKKQFQGKNRFPYKALVIAHQLLLDKKGFSISSPYSKEIIANSNKDSEEIFFIKLIAYLNTENYKSEFFHKFLIETFGQNYFKMNFTPVSPLPSETIQRRTTPPSPKIPDIIPLNLVTKKLLDTPSLVSPSIHILQRLFNNDISSSNDEDIKLIANKVFYLQAKNLLNCPSSITEILQDFSQQLSMTIQGESLKKLILMLIDHEYTDNHRSLFSEENLITHLIRSALNKTYEEFPNLTEAVKLYAKRCLEHEYSRKLHYQAKEKIEKEFSVSFRLKFYSEKMDKIPQSPSKGKEQIEKEFENNLNHAKEQNSDFDQKNSLFIESISLEKPISETLEVFSNLNVCDEMSLKALKKHNNQLFTLYYCGANIPENYSGNLYVYKDHIRIIKNIMDAKNKIQTEKQINDETVQNLKRLFILSIPKDRKSIFFNPKEISDKEIKDLFEILEQKDTTSEKYKSMVGYLKDNKGSKNTEIVNFTNFINTIFGDNFFTLQQLEQERLIN